MLKHSKENEEYLGVEGHPALLRDKNSKAILSTNISAYNEYKNRKKLKAEMDTVLGDINNFRDQINSMKLEIGEIKNALVVITELLKTR